MIIIYKNHNAPAVTLVASICVKIVCLKRKDTRRRSTSHCTSCSGW